MRILIVGGASNLAQALKPVLAEFADVVTAGRAGCDLYLDLSKPLEKFECTECIDVVINTSAKFGDNSLEGILQTENVNVLGVLRLCQWCSQMKIRHLIQISSIFAGLDKHSQFYSFYSLSKKHADELTELYSSRFGLPLTILRPAQFYGVGESFRQHQPFLYTIIDKAATDQEIQIYGTNDALRNFIHVDDIANIIALVIKRNIQGTYHCMYPQNVSYSEVAKAAIAAFDSKSALKFMPQQPDIPDNVFEFDDSLYRLINYFPQISIEMGIKKEADYRKGCQ